MKFTMKSAMVASVAAMGLSLAACDSAAENEMEDQAEAMEDQADAEIDAAEDAGMMTDEQADAAEDQVEAEADAMEDAADDMDATPE